MIIKNASFISSYTDPEAVLTLNPQICVAGRSNCGKSTLLNMLMGAKLCKTSGTPGCTKLINVFGASTEDGPIFFVDLPGYGYNAANKHESDEFSERTDRYFKSHYITQTLCLMDVRRDPSDLDKTLINYLRDLGLPFTVVVTKADKLSRAQLSKAVLNIATALGLAQGNIIVTAARTGQGRDALLARLQEILEA